MAGWPRGFAMLKEKKGSSVNIRGFDIQPIRVGVLVDEFVQGDVGNLEDVKRALKGVDTVFHVAALVTGPVERLYRVNVTGVTNVITACSEFGVKRIIYTSTASVVYDGEDIINGTESLPYQTKNLDAYNITKAKAEQIVLKSNSSKLATCALRPHSIYGPGDPESWPRILQSARNGSFKWKFADDKYLSSYTFIDNICHAELLAAEKLVEAPKTVGGNAYNINDGKDGLLWSSLLKVASLAVTHSNFGKFRLPFGLLYWFSWFFWYIGFPLGNFTPYALKLVSTTHTYSTEKAKKELLYQPIINSSEGWDLTMKHFADWSAKNPVKPRPYLSYWLMLVSGLSIFGSLQAFYHTYTLQTKQFSLKPEEVTPLAAKLFGVWTLVTSLVRWRCAFNLENKVLYSITLQTFFIAIGIYSWEFFVSKSIPIIPFMGPGFVASTSIIWMTLFPPRL